MVSFRFHLVSLTGLFLALAIGIGIGATSVNRGTASFLRDRLTSIEARIKVTDAENETLRRLADDLGASEPSLVNGRLSELPVIIVEPRGVDRGSLDHLRDDLVAAGAKLEGTLTFLPKLRLDTGRTDDIRALGDIVGTTAGSTDEVRQALYHRLAGDWAKGVTGPLLPALRDAGFVDYQGSGDGSDLSAVPSRGTYVVVASSATSEIPNEQLARPLVSALAGALPRRVVAVEPGRDPSGKDPGVRAVFVGPLRTDGQLSGVLSTVDDLESPLGRLATVYALQSLLKGRPPGHFGIGPGHDRALPPASQ